jgi:peptidoglycan hydrolase CwlO-like protein
MIWESWFLPDEPLILEKQVSEYKNKLKDQKSRIEAKKQEMDTLIESIAQSKHCLTSHVH